MQFIRIASLVICLAGSAAACSRNVAQSPSVPVEGPARSVTIDNDNWLDVVVYVVRNGMRQRLGVVRGLGAETLRLPGSMAPDDEIRFLLDPIGSEDRYILEPVHAGPDQRILLRVGTRLSMSTLAVFNR